MTDYQIYKKLRPFLLKRLLYALLGLILMIIVLIVATYLGMQYPEYRVQIIFLCAVAGIFVGWKIIRKGEIRYRMAQVAMVTDIVRGDENRTINSAHGMERVKKRFKYLGVFNLMKNIWRHKNFKKVGQFVTLKIANLIPYLGTCSVSWLFAHPEDDMLKGSCHAISNYYANRKVMRPKVIKAFIREIVLVVVLFFVILGLEWVIYRLVMDNVTGLDAMLDKVEDFTETIELVYDWYFEDTKGFAWTPLDVMWIIALYIAWFIKVFSIRAFQMIAIIREYLALGDANPPSDELYLRLMTEIEKNTTNKSQQKGKSKQKGKNQQKDKSLEEGKKQQEYQNKQVTSDEQSNPAIENETQE